MNLILGKRILVDLKAGDPILLSAVQGSSADSRMSEKIPPGKRLFTLTVSDLAASKGFIKPNDKVDILAHMNVEGRGTTTFTILQDINLVSVGDSTVLDSNGKSSGSEISFFVDATRMEMLSFAQKQGQFSLALRNPQDIGMREQVRGVDKKDFLDSDEAHKVTGGAELIITEKGKLKGKKNAN